MKVEKLKGKKVVVLGGTSGLGLAAAKAAAAEGAHVVVCSRHRANVDKALLELPSNAEGAALDVTDEGALQQFFAGLNGLDHLIYAPVMLCQRPSPRQPKPAASSRLGSGEPTWPPRLRSPTFLPEDRSRLQMESSRSVHGRGGAPARP
ncbi:MAG: short-chain dehydrogenase/reductase [Edaphobacter sp.]|nr:short-chain dehydrogenase/reductase [Edaphobacter sp.]